MCGCVRVCVSARAHHGCNEEESKNSRTKREKIYMETEESENYFKRVDGRSRTHQNKASRHASTTNSPRRMTFQRKEWWMETYRAERRRVHSLFTNLQPATSKRPKHGTYSPAGFGCPRGGTCRWSAARTVHRRSPVPHVLGIGGRGVPTIRRRKKAEKM